MPERPKGAVCKIAGDAYGGSNPPPPTNQPSVFSKLRRLTAQSSLAESPASLRAADPQGVFVNEWDLKPVGDGATEVTLTLTFPKLHGAPAMMAPILFPLLGKPDLRRRMALLKQAVESHG